VPRFASSLTLTKCLSRFTRPEALERFACSRCSGTHPAKKKLSIAKLPLVLSLHLKRFRHDLLRGSYGALGRGKVAQTTRSKIQAHVQFPLSSLDLAPYQLDTRTEELAQAEMARGVPAPLARARAAALRAVQASESDHSTGATPPVDAKPRVDSSSLYDLFAVVTHVGQSLNNGHYIAYVRRGDDGFFRCDDAAVSAVTDDDVAAEQGYLLFYIRRCAV
jgi:ubiquitin carboxyl-terminal hydrolase 22/27/51